MSGIDHSGVKSVTPGGSVAGHTPGPWEVVRINERGYQTPDGDSWWVYAGNGNGWVGESYMSACIGSENGAEANARLIAAAPCMLAALEPDFMDAVATVLDANGCHATAGSVRNCAATQRAAITKATAGETRNAEPIHRRDGDAA